MPAAATLLQYEQLLIESDRQQAAMRTARLQDVAAYRREQQQRPTTDDRKNEKPPRCDPDEEDKWGASSLQKFDGEDPDFDKRR